VLVHVALDVSSLLALVLAVPAAGFLLRTYIVFHDCAHGSFLPSKRANAWLGVALGLVDYIETIRQWRKWLAAPSPRKALLKLQLLPRWLTSAEFRVAFTSGMSATGGSRSSLAARRRRGHARPAGNAP
jgi:hypothetical protein